MPGEGRGEGTVAGQPIGPGAVLGGRYRLEAPLSTDERAPEGPPTPGSGGPAPVFWLATDTVLTRPVALHVVPADDPRAAAMVDAARASAAVTDPHLLRVLDCDERDGVAWVVNEWADGTTLASVLEAGPLAAERAARLTREVAEALASAHGVGIAHGRLRPEAVLLTEAGTVRLIGFAVDAALERAAAGLDPARPSAAAHEPDPFGYEVGDPVQGDVIDLAALLYAGLTGRWAGVVPSRLPLAPADARGPLRPRQVRAGVPRMLDLLCERVLRREAHEHALPVETAHEILAALTDQVGDQATGVLSPEEVTGVTGVPVSSNGDAHHGAAPGVSTEPTIALPASSSAPSRAATTTQDPDATQAALPVADLVDSPERPLFASTERRTSDRSRGSSAWLYGDAAATGTLDPVLDPAFDPDPGLGPRLDAPARRRRTPVGVRRVAALSAVLLLAVAMVVAFEMGRNGGKDTARRPPPGPATKAAPHTPLKLAAVKDFDPQGHPSTENPAEVPRATDGDPGTGWTTLTYTRPNLGGLKSGVGLRLDLGRDRSVGSVDLLLRGSPTDVALYAAPAGESTAPADISGLRRVAQARGAGRAVTLRPSSPVTTRYLVVWLTSLPPVGGGYRGEIDELTVRG